MGAVVGLALAGGLVFLVLGTKPSEAQGPTERTTTASLGTVSATVSASGRVEPASTTDLTFNVSGQVASVTVEVGAIVTKGQVLATLAADDAETAVSQAQAAVDKATSDLTAAQQQSPAASQSISAAQYSVSAAQLSLQQAEYDLANLGAETQAPQAEGEGQDQPGTASNTKTEYQAKAAVDQARSALERARSELTQANAQQTTIEGRVLEAESQLAQAQDQLTQAKQAADSLELSASVAGIVTAVGLEPGQNVTVGAAGAAVAEGGGQAITLATVDKLTVSSAFAEADAAALEVGQAAQISFPALDQVTAEGEVTWISPMGSDNGSVVTFEATITLDQPPSEIRLGQSANLTVVTAQADNVLTLPSAAVTIFDATSGTVQLQTSDGQFQVQEVGLGLHGDSSIEITSGLEADQVVLISLDVATGAQSNLDRQFGGGPIGGTIIGPGFVDRAPVVVGR